MSDELPLIGQTKSPREQGMDAYHAKVPFNECPRQGFREEDIDWRWHWQKGWLRAQLDEKDKKHPPDHRV